MLHFLLQQEECRHASIIDDQQFSPLYQAVCMHYSDLVRMLLVNGANVSLCNREGYSTIYLALAFENISLVKILIEHGTDVQKILLYKAVQLYSIDVLRLLLQTRADVSRCDEMGWLSLHEACFVNDEEKVLILLEYGAKVLLFDERGRTTFHIAVEQCAKNELLLNNSSILFFALEAEHNEVVILLLQHGADVKYFLLTVKRLYCTL